MVKLSYVGLGLNAFGSGDTQAPTSEAHRCKLWIHATLMKYPTSLVNALLFKQRVEITKSMKTHCMYHVRRKLHCYSLDPKCALQADPHYCDLQFPLAIRLQF